MRGLHFRRRQHQVDIARHEFAGRADVLAIRGRDDAEGEHDGTAVLGFDLEVVDLAVVQDDVAVAAETAIDGRGVTRAFPVPFDGAHLRVARYRPVRSDNLRRLHLAARAGETLFFMMRPAAAATDASPAALRLSLEPTRGGINVGFVKQQGPVRKEPLFLPMQVGHVRHVQPRREAVPAMSAVEVGKLHAAPLHTRRLNVTKNVKRARFVGRFFFGRCGTARTTIRVSAAPIFQRVHRHW